MPDFHQTPELRRSSRLASAALARGLNPAAKHITDGDSDTSGYFRMHSDADANVHVPSSPISLLPCSPKSSEAEIRTSRVLASHITSHGRITVKDADKIDNYLSRDEVISLVKVARSKNEIQIFPLDVYRYVDGKWLIPQSCEK